LPGDRRRLAGRRWSTAAAMAGYGSKDEYPTFSAIGWAGPTQLRPLRPLFATQVTRFEEVFGYAEGLVDYGPPNVP
jgi:hypothetical protein